MENHECYKKKNRSRPLHCQVCLKLLSNSWSLNRHMKIHRNTDTEPTNLYKSPGDKTFHQCISLKETRESSCEENNENLKCSVCNRQYKNINGLEKHLRTTHTVHTKEMSFIQKARNKPILSKNSTPIKPSVAKALVSKLTKRKEANSDTQHKSEIYEKTTFDNYSKPSIDIVQNIKLKGHAPVDKKTVIEKYESETNNSPILDGENSEEHHTECRKIVFYRCPYCEKPPLKARSSLKKHFSRAHGNYINEWKASNFLSKQILRDDKVIRRLRNKYNEKKRLQVTSGKLNLKIKKKKCILPIRKTTNEPYSDLNIDKTEANIRNTFSTSTKVPKTKKNNDKTFDIMCINSSNIGINSSIISNENVLSKINEHENIDNLFFENLNIFLDPLNENTYTEDVTIQSINYIQENFQNSFDKIQEKLDAELQLSQERDLIWKNSCNFGGLSEEVISKNAYDLDESVMLNLN
ncbi:uncharacterized protein LOC134828419 [Culicoides brevitarsis]|uniref:uncharacterized protein LOC134828419 n=1 Tax=Culicoides brevitarsis TaxID=469753 RepID=UPI00307C45F3